MRRLILSILLLTSFAHAASQVTHLTIAGRDVAVWKPAGPVPAAGYPLVVFSHGFGGCNTQSVFLMEALARAGYLVLAPNHKDARCGTARKRGGWYPGKLLASRPQEPFRDPDKWTDATYKDRAEDVEAVLNPVLESNRLQGVPVDPRRIGISGHSLGGYTALGLSGGWPSWKDDRIKAVLALSPHCSPFVQKGDLRHLNIPVMYQGGTRDLGETKVVKQANGAYDQSSAPKFYVELDGAGHFAWTDLNRHYQQLIDEYSVAFFDRYLKGKTSPDSLALLKGNSPPKGVSQVRAKE
jgi:predicted dienelactone hydrolase